MIFDTIAALADYLNDGKFDNSATKAQCEESIRNLLNTNHETLTVGEKIFLNNELNKFSAFSYEIQYRTPRSEYEAEVSNMESSSSSSNSSIPAGQFQIEVTITEAGSTVFVHYSEAVNFTVDWGDGSPVSIIQGSAAESEPHEYLENGVYTISMSGRTSHLSISDDADFGGYVTEILSPIQGITGLTSVASLFEYQFRVSSIPAGMFDSCPDITNFSGAFVGNYLLTEIPAGLFDVCVNAINFNATFWDCGSLVSVPSGLFSKCTKATSFGYTFAGCGNLETVPGNIFENCVNVESFEGLFGQCERFNLIPTGLFDDCPKVVTFEQTFGFCPLITSIPAGLFTNCTLVQYFNETFFYNIGLLSIPATLFDTCTAVTTFEMCFEECTSATGNAPALWSRDPVPTGDNCFLLDTNLTNYASIPESWR